MGDLSIFLTVLGLVVAIIAAYFGIKQYLHQINTKEKQIIVNVKPEIKIEPGIKIANSKVQDIDESKSIMDGEYYTKLGVDLFRTKKQGDDFDIKETF